jgi:hypothetical protein
MKYKAFEDFYKEETIKHLVLHNHNNVLVSPPFATEQCKDYSKVMCKDGDKTWFIDLDLPAATSKFNAISSIGDSVWFIPYGIWDNFNVVVQLKDFKPIYHYIDKPGKGQFYSSATDGTTAFSFPLGYEETSYGIYIKDDTVHTVEFDRQKHTKTHMGTVHANGRYWSAPRGDTAGYINMTSFDGINIEKFPINVKNPSVTRKYSDIIVNGNILYILPFGEAPGVSELIEFDTVTNKYKLYELDIPDFAKKYNAGVLVEDTIIALPYGDEHASDSQWGLTYNIITGKYTTFDIGLSFGGKYRFRSGIAYGGNAMFLPTGTPSCPILTINKHGKILARDMFSDHLLGRPIIHKNSVVTMGHNFNDQESYIVTLDSF